MPEIHSKAIVESERIGERTRVWAFTHVMAGATIGEDCNVGEGCYVESGSSVGDRVTLKNGVSIWDGVSINDDVFIGPQASFTNDLWPRPRAEREDLELVPTKVLNGASIGANATIVCGVTIGHYAFVGAGSVVTRDIPDFALCYGNPAKLKGFLCRCRLKLKFNKGRARCKCGKQYKKNKAKVEEII